MNIEDAIERKPSLYLSLSQCQPEDYVMMRSAVHCKRLDIDTPMIRRHVVMTNHYVISSWRECNTNWITPDDMSCLAFGLVI